MSVDLSALVRDLAAEKKREDDIPGWLDDLAGLASRVQRGTHGPKFSHSAITPNAGIAATANDVGDGAIGTHSLSSPVIDTFCNATYLGVGVLLDLADGGESLADQVAAGDPISLRPFGDEARAAAWIDGLSNALEEHAYAAHPLSKQVYFPVGDDYHLISPLFAASLAHEVWAVVQEAKFSDESKEVRAARRVNRAAERDSVDYTGLATMKFGGAQPQNVSLLNSRRRGTAYLLNCAPPTWEERLRLPTRGENALWRLYRARTRRTVAALRRFLANAGDGTNVRIRTRRGEYIEELVDELLNLAAGVRELGPPGWSRDSDLPLSEQCFLDPRREDEAGSPFALSRESGAWREDVSDAFGRFVNDRLSGMRTKSGNRQRDLGSVEAKVWARELRNTIARLRDRLEGVA